MIKRLLISGFALLFAFTAFSANVKLARASQVAKNFYYERASYEKVLSYASVKAVIAEQKIENGQTVYYAFNVNDHGFVLVSADDQVVPVLGYSFESAWGKDQFPVQMTDWLKNYQDQIAYCRSHETPDDAGIQSSWVRLSANEPSHLLSYKSANNMVGPLLISTWNQDGLYNDLCPLDPAGPGGRVYVGCVATAMAQIMYYYRWPHTGVGTHNYNSDYGNLTANFGNTTYDWNKMLNSINSPNLDVATISYHCGVAVNMMYAPDGSGAYSGDAANAFKNYFRYSSSCQLVDKGSYSELDWANLMRAQLDAKKPLYYHGFGTAGGHAFNLDGYEDGDYFHFNWGWSGSYNGYFYLNNLNPGYTFNNGQGAIIDIFPAGEYPPNCVGSSSYTALKGTIEDGSGPLNYIGNNDCYYLINPQVSPQDSISNIILRFNQFETESTQDVLTIYDGPTTNAPVLGTFSGSTIPANITSGNNKVLLHFTSDNAQNKNGWFLTYEAKAPVFCHDIDMITTPSGVIEDGSGPKNYQDKVICQWLIHPSNVQSVTLNFDQFSLDNGGDFVEVYAFDTENSNGTLIGHYSGQNLPPSVTSTTGAMFIIFQTNNNTTNQGWKAHFVSQSVGVPENNNKIQFNIFPNPSHDQVEVSFNSNGFTPVEMSLFTPGGVEVKTYRFDAQSGFVSHQIDMTDLAKGMYFLRMRSEQGDSMHKLILQ